MVLWEITLATAYVLGLRKTYRLVLRLERRLLSKHPRVRDFAHRRIRSVFDVALRVHRTIQDRDIATGKSVGNWILRMLDRMRPQANIRGPPHPADNNVKGNAKKLNQSENVDNAEQQNREHSGGRNVNFVQSSYHNLPYGPCAGVGTLSGVYEARPVRSLPQLLLENYWGPLKRRIESSQQHRRLSGFTSAHHAYRNSWS